MKKRLFLPVIVTSSLLMCLAMTPARLEVKENRENVVASRLEGEWQLHLPLTERLLGKRYGRAVKSTAPYISFESEESIVQEIPAKYEDFLKDKTIYMAGIMTRRPKEYPFILIELFGNPRIVYFREASGEPLGDAESFNLMLAPATHEANDLLFIGGDQSHEPFLAYERKQERSAEIPPQAKPVVNWLQAMKTSNLELFKSVYSQRMQARFENQGWNESFSKYQHLCRVEFGDFELTDFWFSFEGDEQAGKVKITFKDRLLPPLDVIKDNDEWKINER